ncbi:MAG: cytochrome c oxidase subunit II [Planctomycetaceae bacterium]|nr:MAG: cytochrome c oxidase subunit II [Planctomycetaceae bacterium]
MRLRIMPDTADTRWVRTRTERQRDRGNFRGVAWGVGFCVVLALLMTGCQGDRVQSALHPAGPAAQTIATLWWVLLAVCGIYTVGTFALFFYAIFRPKQEHAAPHGGNRFILTGGVFLPFVVLLGLLLYSVQATTQLQTPEAGLTIRVVGHRFWWEVEYPEYGIVNANELHIPVGEPVHLELTSGDVIHSFWVPQLHGKMDMFPDLTTHLWLQADKEGVYRGQCAEFCGVQHARMAFHVFAKPPKEFAAWVAEKQQSRPDPDAEVFQRGHQVFMRHGCAACHAIRDTEAVARAGPDLTLMGSRRMLGAATLINTSENMRDWLEDPNRFKPGVLMPPTEDISEEEIEALVDYMQSLK